jgi:predicted ester cyclase
MRQPAPAAHRTAPALPSALALAFTLAQVLTAELPVPATLAAAALAAALAAAPPATVAQAAQAGAPVPASPSRPAATAPAAAADHRQENKVLVRRYLTEVLAAGKLDKLDEIVAKTFVDRTPGAPNLRGPAAARQAQQKLRDLFSKVEYDPQALIAEGDQVAARYLVLATPKPERGAPAPPPLLLNGVALFRVSAGRIQEVFVLNDQIGLLRQLGYSLVPPGGASPQPSSAAPHPPAAAPPGAAPPPAVAPPPAAAPPAPAPPPPTGTPPPATSAPGPPPPARR